MIMFKRNKSIGELVAELTELLNKHGLTEIEYEKEGKRIRISNSKAAPAASPAAPAGVPANSPTASAIAATSCPLPENFANAVKSPMVGVLYLKPEPGARDFVVEGQKVKKGDTLCLIEAMKTFNPLKAPADGTLKKILVKDSETVEYDQPLFVIE
jgi:acetyl-CoA carboxylase biotin carboxyl carrier protein